MRKLAIIFCILLLCPTVALGDILSLRGTEWEIEYDLSGYISTNRLTFDTDFTYVSDDPAITVWDKWGNRGTCFLSSNDNYDYVVIFVDSTPFASHRTKFYYFNVTGYTLEGVYFWMDWLGDYSNDYPLTGTSVGAPPAEPEPSPPTPLTKSGIWYNSAMPGTAIYIEIQGDRLALGWFSYHEETGEPMWVMADDIMTDTNHFTADLWRFTNGQSMGGPYVAPNGPVVVGSISITFHSDTTATVTYPGGTLEIERYRME